jgi:IclR family transcriptional regulator, acetate operon repressor
MDDKKNHTRIASLQKSLKILELIGSNPNGSGIKEIAYDANINTSTCYHIINTLVDEDYVIKKADGRYILGVKIPKLNKSFMNSIRPEISLLEELKSLHEQTGETVYLLGVNENHIIMQSIIESEHAIRVNSLFEGYSGNYHARASTKAIIAHWSESKINHVFQNYNFVNISEKIPSNLAELKEQLVVVRNIGFCLDEEETAHGICFIAAPIFQSNGQPIGSYALSIPKERYLNIKNELIESILYYSKRASMFMGYTNEEFEKVGK